MAVAILPREEKEAKIARCKSQRSLFSGSPESKLGSPPISALSEFPATSKNAETCETNLIRIRKLWQASLVESTVMEDQCHG